MRVASRLPSRAAASVRRADESVIPDDTCETLAGVSEPDPDAEERRATLRAEIKACDR